MDTTALQLQFKQQSFQIQAVNAVVDVFRGQTLRTNRFTLERSRELLRKTKEAAEGVQTLQLEDGLHEDIGYRNASIQISDEQILGNIRAVQRCNGLNESPGIEHPKGSILRYNLTIEMETGTGKTYTYTRTMYELYRKYGWSKYIIVVPSIAIREGVYKSFQTVQGHFQEIYGFRITPFIYNSSRPQDIESFASDSRISVMIINVQAFNARGADARRIRQELDQFGSRRPIDMIAQTCPILIIDEPQSVDGPTTLEAMQDFRPLFTLRYSATHNVEYNKVYRLDAWDAYDRQLVKKIQVKGITPKGLTGAEGYLYLEQIVVAPNKPPYALIEFEKRVGDGIKRVRQKVEQGANLFELSGGMPAYRNQTITEIDAYKNRIVLNGQDIFTGDVLGYSDESTFRRIQIRETIVSHLEKERQLFERGIKVLSLFFIDSVEKYRVYDESSEQIVGEYAKIFEEEYNNIRNEYLNAFRQAYTDYLQRDGADKIHAGYFSIDKRGRAIDPRVKSGKEDSEDTSAYDLIMRDKERLLSLDEPVRFIFSHSALKEGWDNPNVFQICALKNPERGSQIRRRQEIGRGMRLCVNQRGIRQDFELLGDQVHEINKLTVIASESYEAFAKGLQTEMVETLKGRPQKVDLNLFIGKLVASEDGNYRLTRQDAKKLQYHLITSQTIDEDYKLTPKGRDIIAQNQVPLPENLLPYKEGIINLLKSVCSGEPIIEDERKNTLCRLNANFSKKEFQELWEKISLKTIYEVRFDTQKLIEESKNRINERLDIRDRIYEVKTGELERGEAEELQEGNLLRENERKYLAPQKEMYSATTYDIVGEIEQRTHLLRTTIVEILKKIDAQKFGMLRKNPEEFIAKCSTLVNEAKANLIFNNIVYHKTDDRHDARTVFTNDKYALRNEKIVKKHIYDYLLADSQIESDFADALENSLEVVVYAKLPRSFYITTPVANYSPDWAIVFDKEKVRHIYFVAETKGSDSDMDLREIEKLKIHCAQKHFDTITGGTVKFATVKTYERLMDIVQMK